MSGPKSAAIAARAKSKTKSGRHALNTKSRSMSVSVIYSLSTNLKFFESQTNIFITLKYLCDKSTP